MKTLSGGPFELQTLPASQIREGQVFLAEFAAWTDKNRYLVVSTENGLSWKLLQYEHEYLGSMEETGGRYRIDPTKGRGMDGVIRM